MTIDLSQFYQVFFDETAEHLAEMERLLIALDVGQPADEDLAAIFRAAHSIKGSSGTFGFGDLAEVTHVLETLLDRLRKHEIGLRPEMVNAFLDTGDVLRSMLAAHRGEGAADPAAIEAVCARLRQLTAEEEGSVPRPVAESPASPPAGAETCYEVDFLPTAEASADPAALSNLLEDFGRLGTVDIVERPAQQGEAGRWRLVVTTAAPLAALVDPLEFVAETDAWRVVPKAAAEERYGFFEPETDAAGAAPEADDFGFFAEAPGAPAASPPAAAEVDEGYGFFAPLPAAAPHAVPVVAEEGDGYGLFAPLPGAGVPAVGPAREAVATEPRRDSRQKVAAGESSIRVGVEKVDQLINLVGELVITQAMLLECAAQMHEAVPERLANGLAQLERNTRDLQESVMSIRMLPISFVFSRFPRVVRDLSAKLGKQVELKMSGESTELDKGLIERIADPLTHLVRNSLDHGIEAPEARSAAGKRPTGTITLRAAHQGGNIVIEVGDDGAGLKRDRILAKARERGLPVADPISDQEVWSLIFEPGFSTAEVVTDVSGRGVGMDVVRRNIQALGGRIEIASLEGVGTRMTVRLPLTLAILDGMSVAVGDQTFIVPLGYVVESLQPAASDIHTLANQARRVIQVRGEYMPVVALHDVFDIEPVARAYERGIMVVLDADGSKAALFVDALVGQHQVVIKSLEQNYRRVAGVSGATIMGDGRVALILDPSALVAMARNRPPLAA